jgi:hypothetical protein
MKKENKKENILNLNITKDDSNLNDFIFCWSQFDKRPNKITIHNTYSTKLFVSVINDYCESKNTFTEIIPAEEGLVINDKILVKISDDIYLSYVVLDRNMDSSIVSDLVIYYESDESLENVQKIIDDLNDCLMDFSEDDGFNLNSITYSPNGLEIEPIESQKLDYDNFELYFSEETFKGVNKLVKKIKKSSKGLSILYGERGTGKTAAINYIADNLDRIVIFIPNTLLEQTINNPDFRNFLKKHHKPILILDDCEMIFNEYFTKSNMIVNNLLQLIDGFISDDINIITIFNVDDDSEIDHTLMDCNNLIDVIEFSYLNESESEELSKIIGTPRKFKEKNKLVDIVKKRKKETNNKIGF